MLNDMEQSIASESADKIAELEKETKAIQESNPYKISDELSNKKFVATNDALYRFYSFGGKGDYYLKIARDIGKRFKLKYSWCIKQDGSYNVVTPIFESTKTIFEDTEKRNKILGKYTKDYNIPRYETIVADFLNETWQLVFQATGYLEILKDKDTAYTHDKFSASNIMQEYLVLSDVAIGDDCEFRLLYAKSESYTLFMHDIHTGGDKVLATFNWQDNPVDLLKADELDDRIQLFLEKLQSVDPKFDGIQIKDELLKSIVELDKNMNRKMELLNNSSNTIKTVIVDLITILRTKHFDNLNQQIKEMLSEHKAPSLQMLADYINASDEFFVVHDIKKKFKRTSHGFVEITTKDISNYFNNEFGYNKISMKRCDTCMDFITRELTIDYDIIQFKNGLYNTLTGEFMENKFASKYIPKVNLTNYSYIIDAESQFKETNLYKENHAILNTDERDGWNWNEHMFYKSVGSCYHATNVAEKMFVIVGRSWSRKSTLLAIIKKIFDNSYCNLKVQQIVKNDRFELVPTVNKCILIDDDASDLQIKNIGNLNSFVTGTGLYVEFKNMNDGVYLNEYNTPRIWCASNELFNVIGSGFKRRLCLILADNVFERDESNKHYMIQIHNGERDKELELMISYSLQLYESEKDKSFLTQEQEDAMYDEFEFKSYAERRFVQDVFDYGDETADNLEDQASQKGSKIKDVNIRKWYISYKDADCVETFYHSSDDDKDDDEDDDKSDKSKNNKSDKSDGVDALPLITIPTMLPKKQATVICRKYLKYQRDQGTIFESQAIPSSKKIKTAMEMFGYNQTKKNITIGGKRTSIDVFENIVIKQDWIEKLGIKRIVQDIYYNDL